MGRPHAAAAAVRILHRPLQASPLPQSFCPAESLTPRPARRSLSTGFTVPLSAVRFTPPYAPSHIARSRGRAESASIACQLPHRTLGRLETVQPSVSTLRVVHSALMTVYQLLSALLSSSNGRADEPSPGRFVQTSPIPKTAGARTVSGLPRASATTWIGARQQWPATCSSLPSSGAPPHCCRRRGTRIDAAGQLIFTSGCC